MSKRPNQLSLKSSKISKPNASKLFRRVFRSTTEVPATIQLDYSAERLDLRGYQLGILPADLFDQQHITWMQLSQNRLKSLPPEIGNLVSLKMLRLYSNQIEEFPPEIGLLSKLIVLDGSKNHLHSICPQLSDCTSLTELNLQWNQITELPQTLGELSKLKSLNLYINRLTDLPESLAGLIQLEELDLSHNRIKRIPSSLGHLENLRTLSLVGNQFKKLPKQLSRLQQLQRLDLRCNFITSIPEDLCTLPVRSLYLCNNRLTKLPKHFGKLQELFECHAEENEISALPDSIGKMKKLRVFRIFSNKLENITKSLGSVGSLIELDASRNLLSSLPKELGALENLEKLYLSNNKFYELPQCLCKLRSVVDLEFVGNEIQFLDESILQGLESLTRLNLNQNYIAAIPDELLHLQGLNILEIASNHLESLPDNISMLSNLTFLNVSHNSLSSLPQSLSRLSQLHRFYVSYNNLHHFPWPDSFGALKSLEEFVGSGNGMKVIPPFIYELSNLVYLDLSGNEIESLHPSITQLTKLKSLLLTANHLEVIHDEFGSLISLTEIDVANNSLQKLPESFGQLINLVDVDLSGNQIQSLSMDLRNLSSLVQMKLAHNRLTSTPRIERGFEAYPWLSLEANGPQVRYAKKSKYYYMFESLYKNRDRIKSKNGSKVFAEEFSIAWAEMRGRRSDQQDTICVLKHFRGNADEYFLGVYDGHGGTISSEVVSNCLHYKFAEMVTQYEQTNPGEFDASVTFTACFKSFQEELALRNVTDGTAVNIVYIRKNVVYVANAGDSRSVLFRETGAYALSVDHKPDDPNERKRLEAAGGVVTGSKRVNGTLALSRALGDCDMQPPLTYEPVITTTPLLATDRYIIIACDGLWDIVSNEKAVQLIAQTKTAKEAAVLLRDFAFTLGSSDNISVIVVKLFD